MRSRRGTLSGLKRSSHGTEKYDSDLEREYMIELEHDPAVLAWTKRHGIEIPYRLLGFARRYRPDFLVTYKDGSREIHETKGSGLMGWASTRRKREAADLYCRERGMAYKVVTPHIRGPAATGPSQPDTR